MYQGSESPNILLNSKRLYLRRIENDDLELLEKLFCDSEMMRYLGKAWTLDLVTETLLEWHNEWGNSILSIIRGATLRSRICPAVLAGRAQ
jgi:RimJ/RimL family protein N-acetyltransferase